MSYRGKAGNVRSFVLVNGKCRCRLTCRFASTVCNGDGDCICGCSFERRRGETLGGVFHSVNRTRIGSNPCAVRATRRGGNRYGGFALHIHPVAQVITRQRNAADGGRIGRHIEGDIELLGAYVRTTRCVGVAKDLTCAAVGGRDLRPQCHGRRKCRGRVTGSGIVACPCRQSARLPG